MSAGLHWIGWRSALYLGFWLIGIVAILQLFGRLLGLWQNSLWIECTSTLWLGASVIGLFLIVDLFVSVDRSFRFGEVVSMKGCLLQVISTFTGHLATALQLIIPAFLSKIAWLAVVLIGMIPVVGEAAFVGLWPLRIVFSLATTVLLVRAALYALIVPLVGSQEQLTPPKALDRAKQLVSGKILVLAEAAAWIGVAFFLVRYVVNGVVRQDVSVAQITQGTSAIDFYTAAPVYVRSLTEVPAVDSPFFSVEDGSPSSWRTLLSILLVLFHVILFIPVYVLLLTLVVLPTDGLVRWLRSLEAGQTKTIESVDAA